jgi:hypothetical protein
MHARIMQTQALYYHTHTLVARSSYSCSLVLDALILVYVRAMRSWGSLWMHHRQCCDRIPFAIPRSSAPPSHDAIADGQLAPYIYRSCATVHLSRRDCPIVRSSDLSSARPPFHASRSIQSRSSDRMSEIRSLYNAHII